MSNRKRPGCGRCGSKHYWRTEAPVDKRPRFVCANCGDAWTCGLSGGEYLGYEKGPLPAWHDEYAQSVDDAMDGFAQSLVDDPTYRGGVSVLHADGTRVVMKEPDPDWDKPEPSRWRGKFFC